MTDFGTPTPHHHQGTTPPDYGTPTDAVADAAAEPRTIYGQVSPPSQITATMLPGRVEDRIPLPAAPCTACGSDAVEQGFIEDGGSGTTGYVRWIPGELGAREFGAVEGMRRPRYEVVTFRCTQCFHLDEYAVNRD